MNKNNKLERYSYTLTRDEHSSLLDPFVSYDEKEVLRVFSNKRVP
jgi:hypothetical protein